jgi:cell division septation protein DedD
MYVTTASPKPAKMSRRSGRAASAPKANVSESVRRGLASLAQGNEDSICAMLSLGRLEPDAITQKMVDVMGVSGISAEQLMANYFSVGMLGKYAVRLGKSDKGGAATLAERIAREWAKPSFEAPGGGGGSSSTKRKEPSGDSEPGASPQAAMQSALAEMKAKRAKAAATAAEAAAAAPMPEPPPEPAPEPEEEAAGGSGFVTRLVALESRDDLEAATQELAHCKITCEDVLEALVKWADGRKASRFLGLWQATDPAFGCDQELMFEAVNRLSLVRAELLRAAGIIGGHFREEDGVERMCGDWDHEVVSEEDAQAFREAYHAAALRTAEEQE